MTFLFIFIPLVWKRVEPFMPGPDYRIPYKLSQDYWLYDRYCRAVCDQDKILLLGDSVIWGEYVEKDQTLSHYLNEIADADRFANMGVDGVHPIALAGLVKYYGKAISGKDVIVQFNLLWMSSKQHDLQVEKEFRFNHPRLVPQFIPRIPCYRASLSTKLSIVVGRNIPFFGWINHLQSSYFTDKDGVPLDLPTWTIRYPENNLLSTLTLRIPKPEHDLRHEAVSWTERGAGKSDIPWIEIGTSLQWKGFQRLIRTLQKRGNRVFVFISPFNEYMLSDKSLESYHAIRTGVNGWLEKNDIAYFTPGPVSSELYSDASHPLNQGYALLAKQLYEKLTLAWKERHAPARGFIVENRF